MAPMAANAAVVSTGAEVTTDDWTGATYSVTGGQVVVSGGGTITQAVETTLQPGKYQVYIATLINVGPTNPLNIKVDGADEGGEGSITINSDVVEFTLTSAKKVTLNITGTNKYTIAGVEIRLDKNFKALGDALEDMLQDVTLSINTYSVKTDWDAENDRIKKVIEKIQKQDIATPDDDAYELYTDEELWNDAAATKTGKDIEALKQNAYKAEKDALEDAVKAAKATVEALPAYEANKQAYKDLVKAAEVALKDFKAGDKSEDLQKAVSDLDTYVAQVDADQADIVAYYDGAHDPEMATDGTVQKAIDEVGALYKATDDWRNANIATPLQTLMDACMKSDKEKFDDHVSTIKQDYFEGKLLTTVIGNVPTAGTWFDDPNIQQKIADAKELFGTGTTSYQTKYEFYNTKYDTYKSEYDALIEDYTNVNNDKTSAGIDVTKDNNKTLWEAVTTAKTNLDNYFTKIANGQKYDAPNNYSPQDITGDVVEGIYAGSTPLLAKDATVMKQFRKALTEAIDAFKAANQAAMDLAKAKREAKAELDALLSDNDDATMDLEQRLNALAEANPKWKEEYGYDVVAAWKGTDATADATAENSIPYLQALINAFINKKNATASDFTAAKVAAKKTEIQAIINGIIASTLDAGDALVSAQRYVQYKKRITTWTEKVEKADAYLKATYPKAYNDPKKAAGILAKYQASYAVSIDSIKATIKVLSDSVASADKKTGNLHKAAMKYSIPNLNTGNFPAENTDPYFFAQLETLLDKLIAGTSDVHNQPLLNDADYDAMVADAAEERLIKTCEEKLKALTDGVEAIKIEDAANLGAAAADLKAAAEALIKTSYDYDEDGSIVTPDESNTWQRLMEMGNDMQGVLTGSSFNSAKNKCRNGETEVLHAYSDYLDYQIAKLNKLKSDVESAKAAVVDNVNFYTEKQIEVGGVKVSPEDLATYLADKTTAQTVTDNQLFTLFNTIVGAIEKNDFKKFKVLNSLYVDIYDPAFEAQYNTLKDAINNTTAGTIQKLAVDLFTSYQAGTIKDDWTKEDGFATQIQNIIKSINMLQTYATDAQATAEAYNAVIDKLVKEDLYDKTVDPTTWANFVGLYKDTRDNVTAADPAMSAGDSHYGAIIVAQYAKINRKGGVVPSVKADYARIKANITADGYEGGCDAIDTEAYNDIIDQVLTTLNGLEELSKANLAAYNQQKEYTETGAEKNIEDTFYAVYGKIEANDKTTKGQEYLKKLQAKFDEYTVKRDAEDAETKEKIYSVNSSWDQLEKIYKKGEASQQLADDLKAIYDAIKEYEKAQAEGFDAAVVADNITAKEAIRTAIATAKDAFKKAVEAQNDTKADSEILQAAVKKAESLAPNFYQAIYQFPENIEKCDNELLAEGTGKVDKWIAAHPGKVYDPTTDVNKIKADFTDKLNKATTDFQDAVKTAAKGAVEPILGIADNIDDLRKAADNFNLFLDKAKITAAKYAQFGYDSAKKPNHTGLYKKYNDLNTAYGATTFSLKALDNALKALGDLEQYTADIQEAFNNIADMDAQLALAEAKKAYDGGEEEFGEASDATEEQKELWAIDRELYTNADGTGLLDFYNEAVSDDDFSKQLGKVYEDFKDLYKDFMGVLASDGTWSDMPNLYTYMHSSAAALQALQDFEDVLNAAVAPHAAAAKGYGAEGDIQKRIADILQEYQNKVNKAVKDNEEGKVNMKEVTTFKNNLTDKVAQLTPTNLALYEKAYIESQMKSLKEQYDKMKKEANAETDEELKATKTAAADQAKKDIDAIQTNVNKVKAIKSESSISTSDKEYAKKLAAIRTNNKEVADAYKALEPEIEALLKTLSENNGVTADAVKKELSDAIAAAKKAADDALAALDDLTEEEKAAYQEKIDADKAALDELQAKVNASENIIGDKDKLASQIAAVQDNIDYTVGNAGAADAATKAKKAASDAAAEGAIVILEGIEEDIAQIKENLENPELFKYITENVYAKRMAGVESAIAELKGEIEANKDEFTVVEYLDAEDEEGNNIYGQKLYNIYNLIDRLKQFTADQEMKAYADDLQQQADAIVIDESKYTVSDFNDLTARLQAIKDAIYKYTPAIYDLTTDPATEKFAESASGLKQEIKEGGADFDNIVNRKSLAEDADNIQEDINQLLKDMDERNIAPEPEIVVPGDITGGGTGEVSDDDIAAFMDAFLADELPSSADPLFAVYDANGDGVLNIADAQAIMNLSAGLNADGTVPGGDLSRAMEAPAGNLTVETESLMNGVTRLTLNFEGNFEYTGFQIDVKGGEVLSESSMNNSLRANTLADGTRRIAAIGTANGNGQVVVIETKGQVELTNVALTTADAKGIVFTLDNATGIYGINADNSNNTIYDLGGKIVNGMKKGVNIIRDAFGNVKKAILK